MQPPLLSLRRPGRLLPAYFAVAALLLGTNCISLPAIDAMPLDPKMAYGQVTGLSGSLIITCNGASQTLGEDGNFLCGASGTSPNIVIVDQPVGEHCTVAGSTITCVALGTTATPPPASPTPTPTGSSTGDNFGTINVSVSGVFFGATISVAVGGSTQTGLGNGTTTFATDNNPGDAFSITIPQASPGLACTAQPASGILGAQGTSVAVQCVRALKLTQNQSASMVVGQLDFVSANAGSGSNGLSSPRGVAAVPQSGTIYISDTSNGRVVSTVPQTSNAAFSVLPNTSPPVYEGPRRISISDAGIMAVADYTSDDVAMYKSPPDAQTLPQVIIGVGVAGTSAGSFYNPTGVCVLPQRFLIADRSNNRVLIYNSIPINNTPTPDMVLGQTNLTSNGSGCSATTMSGPEDVWSDGNYLIVADSQNHRLLVWQSFPSSNDQAADMAVGQPSLSVCNAGSAANQLNQVAAAVADSATLFAVDTGNNRVMAFPLASLQTGMSASYALGQVDTASSSANQSGAVSASTLSSPFAIALFNGGLAVADSGNNRVLLYASSP